MENFKIKAENNYILVRPFEEKSKKSYILPENLLNKNESNLVPVEVVDVLNVNYPAGTILIVESVYIQQFPFYENNFYIINENRIVASIKLHEKV